MLTYIGMSRRIRQNPIQLFEENHLLLTELLPGFELGDRLAVRDHAGGGTLEVRVCAREKYTSTLEVAKHFPRGGRYLPDLHMQVRVYHDAKVAEVLGYQGCTRLPPPYEVSGPGRFHTDERRQVNHLLNDLLRHYVARGVAVGA